jgi:hypothetical protein
LEGASLSSHGLVVHHLHGPVIHMAVPVCSMPPMALQAISFGSVLLRTAAGFVGREGTLTLHMQLGVWWTGHGAREKNMHQRFLFARLLVHQSPRKLPSWLGPCVLASGGFGASAVVDWWSQPSICICQQTGALSASMDNQLSWSVMSTCVKWCTVHVLGCGCFCC